MKFSDLSKTFIDEREVFVDKIQQLTLADRSTVNRWLSGKVTPSKKRREAIAQYLNQPEETLFPETINQ